MNGDDAHLKGVPPVSIQAKNCHTVTVHVQVHIGDLAPDTLRQWVKQLEASAEKQEKDRTDHQ